MDDFAEIANYNNTFYSLGGLSLSNVIGANTVATQAFNFSALIVILETYTKTDLYNKVSANYDGSGMTIETWTTYHHGTFSFPLTVSYIKRNSDNKSIGIIWH